MSIPIFSDASPDAERPDASGRDLTEAERLLDALGVRGRIRRLSSIGRGRVNSRNELRAAALDHLHRAAAAGANTYLSVSGFDTSQGTSVENTVTVNAVSFDLDDKGGNGREGVERLADMLIAWLGIQPRAIVDSGHGWHVHFAVDDAQASWEAGDDDTRRRWVDAMAAIYRAAQRMAADIGMSIDTTDGIERLWRMPGSTNTKPGRDPVPAHLVSIDLDSDSLTLADLRQAARSVLGDEAQPSAPAVPRQDGAPYPELTDPIRYARKALDSVLAGVRAIHDWPEGHQDDRGVNPRTGHPFQRRGWEKVLADGALDAASIVKMPGSGLEAAEVLHEYLQAAPRGGYIDDRWLEQKWNSQWPRAVARTPSMERSVLPGTPAEPPTDDSGVPREERSPLEACTGQPVIERADDEDRAWLASLVEQGADERVSSCRLPMRERVLGIQGLRSLPPVEPLVDGLLIRNTLAQISGPPGEYKTFLTLCMALCVAMGLNFEEHHVPAAGPVVYVAAEGSTGLLARVLAWCHLNNVAPEALEGRFFVLPEPVQMGSTVDVTDAAEFAAEIGAALIVLDTRARCTIGLEENDATAQGTAIAGAERIQRASKATVLVVHHSGRSGDHGRGSTAWDGGVWSDLRVSGGDLRATITCAKHKDIPDSCKHTFELKPVVVPSALMPAATEQARSTLVVVQATPWTTSTLDGKNARIVQKIVWTMAPPNGLPPGQLRDLAMDEGASRSGVYAAVTALVTSGFLRNVGTDKQPRYVTDQPAPPGVETAV